MQKLRLPPTRLLANKCCLLVAMAMCCHGAPSCVIGEGSPASRGGVRLGTSMDGIRRGVHDTVADFKLFITFLALYTYS